MPTAAAKQVSSAMAEVFGRDAAGVWAAPGRVNLIGEHTDYNEGYVMPFALQQRTTVAAAARPDQRWRVRSLNEEDTAEFSVADLTPGMEGWAAYVAGVVWAVREAGQPVPGADLLLTSDVPVGAGLSSSAALECGVLTALAALNGLSLEPLERAKLARRAENDFVGAPTGLMDQAASTLCTAGHVLFFDCRTLEYEAIPFDLSGASLNLLVLDTKTPHQLVDSEYADRRRSCEDAAKILGVPALRDVTDLDAALARLDDAEMRRRVRHVVTEDARVLAAADALRARRFDDLATLLDGSHASMRDDFEITVPTVDLAVEAAREAGAHGARMTGGGFGGCILALVDADATDAVAEHVRDRYADAGYAEPEWFVAVPSNGAGPVP